MAHNAFEDTFETSAVGFALLDGDNRWATINDRLAASLGARANELLGSSAEKLVHPDDRAELRDQLASVRNGDADSSRHEIRLLTREGEPRWVEITAVNATRPRTDSQDRILLIVRDITSRRESERGIGIQHFVSRTLAAAGSVDDALGRILAGIGTSLHWRFGAYWALDEQGKILRANHVWRSPAHTTTAFEEVTRSRSLERGQGIPGCVWETGSPFWKSDALDIPGLPRWKQANEEGLHAVFAFPVRVASRIYGVMEFFSDDVLPPDTTLMDAAEGIGYQIGEFLERHRAQSAGYESEVRKASILETALDCIIGIDSQSRITEFNPAAETTFGYRKEDVIGREMPELIVPPSLREAHRNGLRRYLETGEGPVLGRRIEITGMRSDGSEFPLELAIVRIPLPGPIFFTAYLRDLTERKKLEREQHFLLKASAELSSSLVLDDTVKKVAQLAVPDIADWCAVDLSGENGNLRRVAVAHTDPEKISLVTEIERKYPTDLRADFGVPQVVRTGDTEWAAEIPEDLLERTSQGAEHLNALHTLGLVSYIIVPLKSTSLTFGAVTLVNAESGRRFTAHDVAFAEDLARRMAIAIENAMLLKESDEARDRLQTQAHELEEQAIEMEQAQEELVAANDELAATNELLVTRTEETRAALAAAEQANKAKSEFLATMSHELRTPLNAIGGYAELIKLGIRGPINDAQKADLERIERSQAQLLGLINDVLNFAKVQSGTLDFTIEDVPLDASLRNIDDMVRPQMQAKGLGFTYEAGDPLASVCADRDRLQQVMLNLLSNAVKFTPEGGNITVSWKCAGPDVEISVSDTGIGIPNGKIEKIFDPFVQVDAQATRTTEGVGLGLAISRDIARRMAGELTVRSEVGKGSVFTLSLPRGKDCSENKET